MKRNKPPIDLTLKTMTSKVSVGAHERLKQIADKHDLKIQDVLSACLLYMDEQRILEILAEQEAATQAMPAPVRTMLRHMDKLSDEDRKMLRDFLG